MTTNIITTQATHKVDTNKVCLACQTTLTGKQSKYCSRKCHNKTGNFKFQIYAAQQTRGISRKLALIAQLGGCCQICGYNRNYSALCFHHRDPSTKLFQLDQRSLSNRKQEAIDLEVAKCILLCSNCHFETHHPEAILVGLLS